MRTTLLFAVVAVAALLGCPSPQTVETPSKALSPAGLELAVVEIDAGGGTLRFDVELAQNDPQRQKGLMHREVLGDGKGMLFLFERMRVQSFWMKNTLIPLDMLFIDDHGVIVGIVENAEPMTRSPRTVGKASQYVLELDGGACRRAGVETGMRARFIGVAGHPAGLENK